MTDAQAQFDKIEIESLRTEVRRLRLIVARVNTWREDWIIGRGDTAMEHEFLVAFNGANP